MSLQRRVLVESGHRCAIPQCGHPATEFHHIEPWAKVQEHTFENLIAVCPNDHGRAERGEIDRKSMQMYKDNLAVLTGRYTQLERRLLRMMAGAGNGEAMAVRLDRSYQFEFHDLIEDGLIQELRSGEGRVEILGIPQGPHIYVPTDDGVAFINRWLVGDDLSVEIRDAKGLTSREREQG